MLSLQLIRECEEAVRRGLAARGAEDLLEPILALDANRRSLLQEVEGLRAQRNQRSAGIGATRDANQRQRLIDETRLMSARIGEIDPEVRRVESDLEARLYELPNLPDATVPVGPDESANVEVRQWGAIPGYDFEPRPHWEIGEQLGIIDFERGARLGGSRFHALVGDGAALSRALIAFMLDLHVHEHGYLEVAPPYLVKPEIMLGTGQLPKFAEEAYFLERDDLYLIPTAEVPLTNLHRGEILDGATLPLRYSAHTPCFRREAGAAGRDTRGLIRVHQFDKVEMVVISQPERALDELEQMVSHAEAVLQRLGLAYRVVLLCSGDMGFSAAKTYDLEVWMPGQGRYVEISSCSTCADFQARRADIKFRREAGSHAELVNSLNGSGVAIGRAMAAILETYQTADGGVEVPEALRPYLGGRSALRSTAR